MTSRPENIVSISGFGADAGGRTLFSGLDLDVGPGESVAIMGPSGSGKTTLLHCLAGLRLADRGTVSILGRDLASLSSAERSRLRLESIGLVLQFGELLPELRVGENVALPQMVRRGRASDDEVRAALEQVEMAHHSLSWPAQLSGGEMQRVAIARALVCSPRLILADEPTGSVDDRLGRDLIDLLVTTARRSDAALLVVTHDVSVARRTDRVLQVAAGALQPVG